MSNQQSKDLFILAGQVVLVTGGAGLLGQVFCQAFVEAGANIAIVDLNKDAANAVASKIAKSKNQKVIAVECDVTSPQSVSKMIQSVVTQLDRIDVLVNNAASKGSNLDAFFEPFLRLIEAK